MRMERWTPFLYGSNELKKKMMMNHLTEERKVCGLYRSELANGLRGGTHNTI